MVGMVNAKEHKGSTEIVRMSGAKTAEWQLSDSRVTAA